MKYSNFTPVTLSRLNWIEKYAIYTKELCTFLTNEQMGHKRETALVYMEARWWPKFFTIDDEKLYRKVYAISELKRQQWSNDEYNIKGVGKKLNFLRTPSWRVILVIRKLPQIIWLEAVSEDMGKIVDVTKIVG